MSRLRYRVWQFGQYVLGRGLTLAQDAKVGARLGPPLSELFHQMSRAEQAHAYRVVSALVAQGATDDDLLAAALLHDAGKTRAPLNVFERTAVVLCRKFAPGLAARWGQSSDEPRGWRRAFVVAAHHAAWGAAMAARAGASARAVSLIRRHQTSLPSSPWSDEEQLLAVLQRMDGEN